MKKLAYSFIGIGIIIRCIYHFIEPTFNIDEIWLGNNIKNRSFLQLLYPLDDFQSAPPLYLWLQKSIIVIGPFNFWINIKVLSFLASIASLMLWCKLITKKYTINIIGLLMISIFVFNPFIIYNSLTLKQYGLDLVGVLILFNYHDRSSFKKYAGLFFMIWILISNAGLFGCVGYLVSGYFKNKRYKSIKVSLKFIKDNIKIISAPIPYIVYFFWYMQQEGANELKQFMVSYWQTAFIPLNLDLFKYLLYLVHQIWIYFYNAYEIIGISFMALAIASIYYMLKGKNIIFKSEIQLGLALFLVHLVLNLMDLYPLSDRLILYMVPLFILLLVGALHIWLYKNRGSSIYKNGIIGAIKGLLIINLFCYLSYTPYRNNDVVNLYKKINNFESSQPIYLSRRSKEYTRAFDEFTNNSFSLNREFKNIDTVLLPDAIVVSKIHNKIKPNKTSKEEFSIQKYIDSGILEKVDGVDGYNIHRVRSKKDETSILKKINQSDKT